MNERVLHPPQDRSGIQEFDIVTHEHNRQDVAQAVIFLANGQPRHPFPSREQFFFGQR